MESNDYPPAGGMSYKDFYTARNSFGRMYQVEAK